MARGLISRFAGKFGSAMSLQADETSEQAGVYQLGKMELRARHRHRHSSSSNTHCHIATVGLSKLPSCHIGVKGRSCLGLARCHILCAAIESPHNADTIPPAACCPRHPAPSLGRSPTTHSLTLFIRGHLQSTLSSSSFNAVEQSLQKVSIVPPRSRHPRLPIPTLIPHANRSAQTHSQVSDNSQMARSKDIAPHVGRLSRSQVAAKRGLHKGGSLGEFGS